MSSQFHKPTISMRGVFDKNPEISAMHDANKVYVRYCTSDGHMGDQEKTEEIPYQFRGQKVVEEVFHQLQEVYGLVFDEDHWLLFGGHSAGGRGAMVHLDNVEKRLGGVQVAGLLDSPLYLDLMPLYENLSGLNEHTKLVH